MVVNNLIVERRETVAIVTVNRPKVLNALNRQTLDELYAIVIELTEASAVRSVILTGSGNRAFVAGADVGENRKAVTD